MSDVQKLDQAFTALAGQGVISRHNFWCCGGCAGNGIANWYDAADDKTKAATVGYVFYHEQEAEHAINGHGLSLFYGSLPIIKDGDRGDDRATGEKIVAALCEQGFTVNWDGDPESVIDIPKFAATLDEFPRGEGSTLHDRDDEDDEDDWWGDEEDEDDDEED